MITGSAYERVLDAFRNDLSDTANKCVEYDERLVPGWCDPLRNRCSGGCG